MAVTGNKMKRGNSGLVKAVQHSECLSPISVMSGAMPAVCISAYP